jgi:hypothetical protein
MRKEGYVSPKWTLINKKYPYKWRNNNPSLLEEKWLIDLRGG